MKAEDVIDKVKIALSKCEEKLLRYVESRLVDTPKLKKFYDDEDEILIREIWVVFDENANDPVNGVQIGYNASEDCFVQLCKPDIKNAPPFKESGYILSWEKEGFISAVRYL